MVVPAGNGTLVLGLWLGFRELAAGGHIDRLPAIVAVQAERCAPLAGRRPTGTTAADRHRHRPIRPAAERPGRPSWPAGARSLTVAEEELELARRDLARMGWPSSRPRAVAWAAALPADGPEQATVVVLSGAAAG